MADKIVHNHTPKAEKEEHGLFDCFGKKDENKCEEIECKDEKNEGLLAKLHLSDGSSSVSSCFSYIVYNKHLVETSIFVSIKKWDLNL